MYIRRNFCRSLALVCTFNLCGCWTKREVNSYWVVVNDVSRNWLDHCGSRGKLHFVFLSTLMRLETLCVYVCSHRVKKFIEASCERMNIVIVCSSHELWHYLRYDFSILKNDRKLCAQAFDKTHFHFVWVCHTRWSTIFLFFWFYFITIFRSSFSYPFKCFFSRSLSLHLAHTNGEKSNVRQKLHWSQYIAMDYWLFYPEMTKMKTGNEKDATTTMQRSR